MSLSFIIRYEGNKFEKYIFTGNLRKKVLKLDEEERELFFKFLSLPNREICLEKWIPFYGPIDIDDVIIEKVLKLMDGTPSSNW